MALQHKDLFSTLPPELRLEIYEQLWDGPVKLTLTWDSGAEPTFVHNRSLSLARPTALLCTSRAIHAEAEPILARKTVLSLVFNVVPLGRIYNEEEWQQSLELYHHKTLIHDANRIELKIIFNMLPGSSSTDNVDDLMRHVWHFLWRSFDTGSIRRVDLLTIVYDDEDSHSRHRAIQFGITFAAAMMPVVEIDMVPTPGRDLPPCLTTGTDN